MWYNNACPSDTEKVFTTCACCLHGNVFFEEVLNRGALLKLIYVDLVQSDFDYYYHVFFSGHIHA